MKPIGCVSGQLCLLEFSFCKVFPLCSSHTVCGKYSMLKHASNVFWLAQANRNSVFLKSQDSQGVFQNADRSHMIQTKSIVAQSGSKQVKPSPGSELAILKKLSAVSGNVVDRHLKIFATWIGCSSAQLVMLSLYKDRAYSLPCGQLIAQSQPVLSFNWWPKAVSPRSKTFLF